MRWITYKKWTNEQKGKTLTVYTYREPEKNWAQVINSVTKALQNAKVEHDDFPFFDLPLQSPYWSARAEGDSKDPVEYRYTDQIWEYYVNELEKAEDKREKNILDFQPKFKKFYEDGGCNLIRLSSSITQVDKVIFIYDLILQNAYLEYKEPSKLDNLIQSFVDITVIRSRREKIKNVFSSFSGNLMEASEVVKHILEAPMHFVAPLSSSSSSTSISSSSSSISAFSSPSPP